MSADKYPSIFSRQTEPIVCIYTKDKHTRTPVNTTYISFRKGVTNILFTNSSALFKKCDNLLFIHKDIFTLKKYSKLPPSDLIHLIVHLEFQLRATSEPNDHWKKKINKHHVSIKILLFCTFTSLFGLNANTELLQTNAAKPEESEPEQKKKKKNGKPLKTGLALRFFKTSYEYEPMEVHLEGEGEVIMEVCQILLYSSEIGRFRDISYFNLYIAHYTGFQCKTKL